MIIDFHVHPAHYKIRTPAWEKLFREVWGDRVEWMVKTYSSPTAFLGLMDEAGIDYAVILAELAPITTGIAENEYVAEFCSQSERLVPFASINPFTCKNPRKNLNIWCETMVFAGLSSTPRTSSFTRTMPGCIRFTRRRKNSASRYLCISARRYLPGRG